MPPSKPPLTIKFDFRHLIPGQDLNNNTVSLEGSNCFGQSLPIIILAENLIPGHFYRTEYSLISPLLPNQPFNPASSNLYASYNSQNFVTALNLPAKNLTLSSVYILQATTTDVTEGFSEIASRQISLTCGPLRRDFEVEILDPSPVIPDNIIDLDNCNNPFPLVGVIKNATVGKEYSYEFYDNPVGGIVFEKKKGDIYAGDINQNFNSKIALTGYPYVFVHAEVKDKSSGISRISEPVLLKCYQSNPCDVVLPTGIDVNINASTYRRCFQKGLTNESISLLSGGSNFCIGDKLTTVGGGGYGAEITILSGGITEETINTLTSCSGFNMGDLIEISGGGGSDGLIKIISGSLTSNSIVSISGCAGFSVGDHLTTVGGEGKDVLLTVTSTGVNGSISSYNITNPGYGFTNIPSGVLSFKNNSSCASATFSVDNFGVPARGGLTRDAVEIYGGSGYNIGEVISFIGGGGSGGQVKLLSGSLTSNSITSLVGGLGYSSGDYLSLDSNGGSDSLVKVTSVGISGSISGYQFINGGYGFRSAPNSVTSLTGSGLGAILSSNSNNFAISSKGSLTKSSIINLTNNSIGHSVGSKLIAIGGGGGGGIITVTSVNNNGGILNFVVQNGGYGYSSAPILVNENQLQISPQPLWDVDAFTSEGYAVLYPGSGYINAPVIMTSNGNGSGSTFKFKPDLFIDDSFMVVNPGSAYTSAPSGIIIRSGDGSCSSASFNNCKFTIACAGGITYKSIDSLIGKTLFTQGEELVVEGGNGSGGRIKITQVNNGAIVSFVILNPGCGYTSTPSLKKLNGSVVPGITFHVEDFTKLGVDVTNPGIGFVDAPTGLEILTGNGRLDDAIVLFNDDNFIELSGPPPTPSMTPSPTVTPSPRWPQCNDLQSAGDQNFINSTKIVVDAQPGQDFLIVEDVEGLKPYSSILVCLNDGCSVLGVPHDTYITKVENWFANFNDRTVYKKITLSNNTLVSIPKWSEENYRKPIIYNTDVRLIKVPHWAGTMTFSYDAYLIPDRFKLYAVFVDTRYPDMLLYDSGYVGTEGSPACIPGLSSNTTVATGMGGATVNVWKPDGCEFIRVVVEAPCPGTAWEYNLKCPIRTFTTISPTPTTTPTKTPTPTPTPTKP